MTIEEWTKDFKSYVNELDMPRDDYKGIMEYIDDVITLLKEQEAVEPKCQIIFDVPYYFCGSCKTMLNMYAVKAKYCSNCARKVKWK